MLDRLKKKNVDRQQKKCWNPPKNFLDPIQKNVKQKEKKRTSPQFFSSVTSLKINQAAKKCIGATIRIGREI